MTRLSDRWLLPAVLVAILGSHALFAIAYTPVHSDIHVYRLYASAVAKGIGEGTSFSVARDEILRDAAERDGQPEPSATKLSIEYPPVAVTWMAAASLGMSLDETSGISADGYAGRFRIAMFLVFALTLLVLVRWATPTFIARSNLDRHRAWRIGVFGIGSLILVNLVFDRLDLVVGALILISIVLLARGAWLPAFVVLAIAINFKASPLALAPLWVIASLPAGTIDRARTSPVPLLRASVTRAVVLAGLTLLVFIPFLVTEGTRALDFLRFRAIQGVHVESLPGSVLLILHQFGMPLEVTATFGTFELTTPASAVLATASPVLLVLGVLAVLALYVRAAKDAHLADDPGEAAAGSLPSPSKILAVADPQLLLIATVATLLLTLILSKLLSPQYLLWILPLVPLLEFGGRRARPFQLWFLLTCAVTTVIFPYLLGRTLARLDPAGDGYLDPSLLGVGLIVARNLLLIWLAWLAIRAVRASRPTGDGVRSEREASSQVGAQAKGQAPQGGGPGDG